MSGKGTKEKDKKDREEAKVEGPQVFAEMCRQMMSGRMSDCCGTEMQGMMSRWMAGFQTEAGR